MIMTTYPVNGYDIEFIWVPPHLGGHRSAPYVGMRVEVRWQRYVKDWLEGARDVECLALTFDEGTGRGTGTFRFSSREPLPDEWLQDGEPVELLNGHRVLAVGRLG